MLPKFPEFKNVSIEDKETIEAHTHKYQPYSDFNFFSLWAWDTDNKRQVSELNQNLVVLITDYTTEEPLLSFLGTNKTSETATTLIQYAKKNGLSPTLRYVPEVSAVKIDDPALLVTEDRDDFDYIYSVEDLSHLKGNGYKSKRHLHNGFENNGLEAVFVQKDITDPTNINDIDTVLATWENNKLADEKEYDLEHERVAIQRLLTTPHKNTLTVSSLLVNGEAAAFSIDEALPGGFAISHFCKADSSHRGIYDYLNTQITKELQMNNISSWNWEQDLGLAGLRHAKMRYRPTTFLKKFKVELKGE